MKKTQAVLAGIAFVFAITSPLQTQSKTTTIQPIGAASSVELAVALQAVEATEPVPAEWVPWNGIFISARSPSGPPLPGPMGKAAWNLGSNVWLVDDLASNDSVSLAAQSASGMRAISLSAPMPGDGGSGTNSYWSSNYTPPDYGSNLFLQISGISNGAACFNLCNSTGQVYCLWYTTNLLAGWQLLPTEVWPGTNQTVTPFTVPTLGDSLFLRAQDWTGVELNGLPCWWTWLFFADLSLNATNLDSYGNSLLADYQNGIDPNTINFNLLSTNQFVAVSGAPVQINVTRGTPFYIAVVLDDTNFTGATWNPYTSSNIIANLGTTPGWHDVWVGLRGLPSNAAQTWQRKHLCLATPPVLVITNPVANVVSQPMIQIYGYCQESLASISYDVSNALGTAVNLPSEITDRCYDLAVGAFTTNYFECLDVQLTNGLNAITIHATDLAGNTTVTNFSFTLDYSSKTNLPVIQLFWPRNGEQISGSNFTWRGWVDDPTATVWAQMVSTNGTTNTVNGLVERNGNFWVQNLPMPNGTNRLTLTVTDSAGNTSVTNITVSTNPLTVTMTPIPNDQLWYGQVTAHGTISDSTYSLWINGVKAVVANGAWTATNVPMTAGGTAIFNITTYAPGETQPDGSHGN